MHETSWSNFYPPISFFLKNKHSWGLVHFTPFSLSQRFVINKFIGFSFFLYHISTMLCIIMSWRISSKDVALLIFIVFYFSSFPSLKRWMDHFFWHDCWYMRRNRCGREKTIEFNGCADFIRTFSKEWRKVFRYITLLFLSLLCKNSMPFFQQTAGRRFLLVWRRKWKICRGFQYIIL